MRNITLEMQPLNPERADEDLRVLFGDLYLGMSTYKEITIHVSDDAGKELDGQIADYFRTHDPSVESAAEQARKDTASAQERLATLDIDALKGDIGKGANDAVLMQMLDILKDIQKSLKSNG